MDSQSDYSPSKGRRRSTSTLVLMALLVVVVTLVVAYYSMQYYNYYERHHIGQPANCDDYDDKKLADMCRMGVTKCDDFPDQRDVDACKAAVGSCMPVAEAASDYSDGFTRSVHKPGDMAGLFNKLSPHIPDCARAAYKISPSGAAKVVRSNKHLLPKDVPDYAREYSDLYTDPETQKNVHKLTELIPGAVDWTMKFGNNLYPKNTKEHGVLFNNANGWT